MIFGKKICQWCVQHEAAQQGDNDDAPQRVMPAPWVRRESSITLTQILFGANISVFIAMALASRSVTEFPGEIALHFGANFGPRTLSGDWWRLVTYMFLHGSLMHIFFNMWCLWDLGRLCESLYGRWTFAAIYLITGVAAGLASVAWNPDVPSVGASGAIFGLAGALIASFYLGEFSLPRAAISGTLRSLLIFAGFNLFFGQVVGGIDNAAHIGGLVSGLILGAAIARLAPLGAPARRAGVIGMVALGVLFCGFGVRQWRGGPMRIRTFQDSKGDSVTRLQAIVRQQPNLAPAHFALAQAYYTRQQFPEAEAEFKRGLELDSKNFGARFDLGMTYLAEKRSDDAKVSFTQMLAQDPNSGDAHYGLGLVSNEQGNPQAAIEEFKKAAASGTEISGTYYEMGNSYAQLKMYDDAIAAYLKEKEKDGDDPDVESALADAYQAKGLTQQSQQAKDRATELRSGKAE